MRSRQAGEGTESGTLLSDSSTQGVDKGNRGLEEEEVASACPTQVGFVADLALSWTLSWGHGP